MNKLYRTILSGVLLFNALAFSCRTIPAFAQTKERAPDGLTRVAQDLPFNKERPPAPLSVHQKREIEKRTAQTLALTRTRAATPSDTAAEFVTFPSAEVESIIGAQLKSGSAQNPWPFFDSNAIAKGHEHGLAFPANPPPIQSNGFAVDDGGAYHNRNYYDQALAQYTNYYRTNDPTFQTYARKVADSWWRSAGINEGKVTDFDTFSYSPRSISLGGLMLRALDGRPEMWPWITAYTRHMFQNWVGARVTYPDLYFGVRDGGYMLLYAAHLARTQPDPAVRAEFKQKAFDAAVNYYARLQYPDGSWRWQDDHNGNGKDDDGMGMQPFMVGLLLEGMGATHRLIENDLSFTTQAAAIKTSIIKSVENLHSGYRTAAVADWATWDKTAIPPKWRGFFYTHYCNGCGAGQGTSAINGDANNLRDVRQLASTIVHAYAWAYKLSADPKFKQWGDEVFGATYGKDGGLLSDGWYGLANYTEKQYSQAYRSGGRYLAWRGGTSSPTPTKMVFLIHSTSARTPRAASPLTLRAAM